MEYYEYKPITAKEHTFRLILLHPASQPKIEIDIIHASLDEDNLIAYEAISYVWGSQQMSTSVFVPEVQKYLKVTNSLELVLRDLRLPDTKRCLWIDGICINQHDQNDIEKIEKNHQVRLMGRIYNSAHRVLFHLGRPTELTPILKDAITEMQQHQALQEPTEATAFQDLEQELEQTLQELEELQSLPGVTELQQRQKTQELDEILNRLREPVEAQKPKKEGTPKTVQPDWELISLILGERHGDFHIRIRQSVELVLQRPWFRRVWIIQEVANAREALMYWGATEVPVRGFIELAQLLRVGMSMHQKAILDMMPLSRRKGLALSSGQDLYDLLVRFFGAEASKSHDKIFALLGMCTIGKGHGTLTIDYSKSLESLVREAVAYMSFCDESDVPDGLSTMEGLMEGLESLFQGLLVHFAAKSKLFSLRSLLANRGDQITITPQIIESTIQNHKGKGALGIIFDLHTDTLPVSMYAVEKAIVQGNHDVMELLLTRLAKRSPCMAKWIRATMANGFSPGTLPQYTPFGLAVMKGEADDVRQLLEEGADVDAEIFWPKTLWSGKDLDGLNRSSFDSRPWLAATEHEMVGLTGVCPDKTNIEETHCRLQTALALAVHHGRDIVVQILLDHGANIEAECGCGRTPLSIAAGRGFDGIVSQGRSAYGAQIVQRTTEGRYLRAEPQVSETDKVYSALVQLLLDRGAVVNSADDSKRSPLWWAVNHGHGSAVEKLLSNKALIANANCREMSLLSWAIWNNYETITAQLLANDALSMILTDDYLEWAIRVDNNALLKELIDRCSIMHGGPFYVVGSPFAVAIEECNAEAFQTLTQHRMLLEGHSTLSHGLFLAAPGVGGGSVEILSDVGSNANDADSEGLPPLSEATRHENSKMLQRPFYEACSQRDSECHRCTGLIHAARDGDTLYAQFAIYRSPGDNENPRCKAEDSALWEAAFQGHQEMVRLLLQHGAFVNVCNDRGTTPLMWACGRGHTAIVELLLDAGADLSIHDKDGRTAIDWAKPGDKDQIAQIFVVKGESSKTCGLR